MFEEGLLLLDPTVVLGEAAVCGNGTSQKPIVFLQVVPCSSLCRRLPGIEAVSVLISF